MDNDDNNSQKSFNSQDPNKQGKDKKEKNVPPPLNINPNQNDKEEEKKDDPAPVPAQLYGTYEELVQKVEELKLMQNQTVKERDTYMKKLKAKDVEIKRINNNKHRRERSRENEAIDDPDFGKPYHQRVQGCRGNPYLNADPTQNQNVIIDTQLQLQRAYADV